MPRTKIFILYFTVCLLFSSIGYGQDTSLTFVQKGDSAYDAFQNELALKNYLKAIELDPLNYDAAWKLSRSYVDIGEDLEGDQKAGYYQKGETFARKATSLNPEGSMGHLSLSIALGRVALDAGPKQRIKMSKEIKKEADLAIKYDATNDIAYHVLGRWNRKLANLSWIEKGFANMFLGGVPEGASNEEAVKDFKKAIDLNPAYINHYLELAKTYIMMDKENLAIPELKKCLELKVFDSDDPKYKNEAKELLKDIE